MSVATSRDGTSRPLEGKIKVAFGGSGWATIFANNTEQEVSDTLNGLGIDVSVERVFLVGGASSTLITFREPRGDVPLIKRSGLVGTGAIARVDEEVKGSCLSGYFRVCNGSRETDPIHWNASSGVVQSELIRSGVVDNRTYVEDALYI